MEVVDHAINMLGLGDVRSLIIGDEEVRKCHMYANEAFMGPVTYHMLQSGNTFATPELRGEVDRRQHC